MGNKSKCLSLVVILLVSLQAAFLLAASNMVITPIQWPEQITPKMLLGKQLFFDKILSRDNKISCSTCHQFSSGGSSADSRPVMYSGKMTGHNSTSIFNLSTNYKLGWIGQLNSAAHQFDKLVKGKKVMGLTWNEIIRKLKNAPQYTQQFDRVFSSSKGGQSITKDNVSAVIVAYETALTTPSLFDRYLLGDEMAISKSAIQGYEVFQRFGCIACHQGKNVGGNLLQKLGVIIPYRPAGLEEGNAHLGRYNLTKREEDKHVFRVPSLRNVALSGPYLHDGSIKSLEGVIKLMAKHQLGRRISQKNVLLISEFLQSLNGTIHPELLP